MPTRTEVIQALRAAQAVLKARLPGQPALAVPVDAVMVATGVDGEARTYMSVEQLIYLADDLLTISEHPKP